MRQLTLTENRTTPAVELTVAERDELRRLIPSLTISPATGTTGAYDLTPGATIGSARLPDLAVVIDPKLPMERVLFMLSYALDPRRWHETAFDYQRTNSLVEAIIPGFVTHLENAVRPGILQGYRTTDEALPGVRGRIRFNDQLRTRFGITPPVEVRYDDFTENIDENRLIKAAITRLGRLRLRSPRARRSLRRFDVSLQLVDDVTYDPHAVPEVTWTRLNERYRPAVDLARLVLTSAAFELAHGTTTSTAVLVDMNNVFENFVVVALREALRLSERTFPQGCRAHRLRLDVAERIRLLPDISWWEGQRCVFVGDVKYKAVRAEGILHPDLYQLLAYTIASDLPVGLLIYAAGEGPAATHTIRYAGKRLAVCAVELAGEPEAILEQMRGIAEQVVALRHTALSKTAA